MPRNRYGWSDLSQRLVFSTSNTGNLSSFVLDGGEEIIIQVALTATIRDAYYYYHIL